jgi:MFS family permease
LVPGAAGRLVRPFADAIERGYSLHGPYAIQFLTNVSLMAVIVYVPLLAKSYGAGSQRIGLLVAVYQAALLVSSMVFGRWADFGDRKKFVLVGLVVATLALFAHTLARELGGLFAVRAVAGICVGVFPAALMAYYYHGRTTLGRFVGFGSLGWGVGAVTLGLLKPEMVFPFAAGVMVVTVFVAAVTLEHQHVRLNQPFFDARVLKRNWRLYGSFFLRHLGAFSIWSIFPVYLSDLGASRFWVGVVFAINPVGQFVFMHLLDRVGERLLIVAGFVLSALVFVAFGFATDFRQVVPVQVFLALSWSCLYLGSLRELMRVNPEKSTAAGVFTSVSSLAAVGGALLLGVTGAFGYRAVMFVAAGLAVLGGLLYFAGPRPPGSEGKSGRVV